MFFASLDLWLRTKDDWFTSQHGELVRFVPWIRYLRTEWYEVVSS